MDLKNENTNQRLINFSDKIHQAYSVYIKNSYQGNRESWQRYFITEIKKMADELDTELGIVRNKITVTQPDHDW